MIFLILVACPPETLAVIEPWRAAIGQQFFLLFGIDLNPAGANFSREFDFSRGFLPPYEKNAWYGPLGALLFLPTIFFYLLLSPFIQKDIWKWLTALLPVIVIAMFALLVRWQTQLGRLLLMAVTLGMPLTAGFYMWSERFKPLRWIVIAVALVVLGWSATHNHHKPVFGEKNIWNRDYYDLRLIRRPSFVPISQYIDTHIPPQAKLGLVGDEAYRPDRTDYLFWGSELTREVIHVGPIPDHIDHSLFTKFGLDYLIFATQASETVSSVAPLWPMGRDQKAHWFVVRQQEVALFTAEPSQVDLYYDLFGDDFLAYQEIVTVLEQENQSFRALTTDPRMPYYDPGEKFTFGFPENLIDLQGFTHLILAPHWSVEDYESFDLSYDEIQFFLSQEQYVQEISNVYGYNVYRLLF